jgi:HAD superfamily hydrolase (TIGR01509 family)
MRPSKGEHATMNQAQLLPLNATAAIFDFDGTLADTACIWHEVDHAFLSKRDLPYTPDYPERLAALGFVGGALYTKERFGLSETVEQICAEWTSLSQDMYRKKVVLRSGAERYITRLRQAGIPCALATTNDASVLYHMQRIDVRSLFDTCVFGAEVGCGKDRPDIYEEAARRLNVRTRDCLVFEDIVPAIRSAKLAGARTCAVKANDPSQQWDKATRLADMWIKGWDRL